MNFYSSSSTNVTKLKHKQPYLFQKIMKIVRNFLTYLWFNFVFHGQILKIKNVKKIQIRRSRFGYESESEYYSSCKNRESESEYSGFGGKDSNPNPNPNIRYNTGDNMLSDNTGQSTQG